MACAHRMMDDFKRNMLFILLWTCHTLTHSQQEEQLALQYVHNE